MNKLILKMPKFVIEKYINEHYNDISEADYFELINLEINIPINLYKNNPQLLNNKTILQHAIKNSFEIITIYPEIIKKIDDGEITDDIVKALAQSNYAFDFSDIKERPTLLLNRQLVLNGLARNPQLLLKLNSIDNELISYALDKGLQVTYDDLINNPDILKYPILLGIAYENDVRVIRFFDKYQLSYELCGEAVKRGYIATEEDLILNPLLCNYVSIMEQAINNDPKIIKYVTNFCGIQLSPNCINQALARYTLTEKDLLDNPELCGIIFIINHYPEYRLYSAFLTPEEKMLEIKKLLVKNDYVGIANLPFLKKELKSNVCGNTASLIAKMLMQPLDDDLITQRIYNHVLDDVIDGIVNIRYKKNKDKFLFPDIVSLHKIVIKAFREEIIYQDEERLQILGSSIFNFINKYAKNKSFIQEDYIFSRISDLYVLYLNNREEFERAATVFYTEILNRHRNVYCSNEKINIIKSIKDNFSLNDRRKRNVYNGKKLEEIAYLIAAGKFEELNTTREEVYELLNKIEEEVKYNKELNKLGIDLSDNRLEELKTIFMKNGSISYAEIAKVINNSNSEVLQYIFKKYNNLKMFFLDSINIENPESLINSINKTDIRFNFNNYVIADKNKMFDNIAKVLLTIDQTSADNIINSKDGLVQILKIVPFVNILPELDTETLIHILENYNKVKEKILHNNININDNIFARFSDVILLSNGYSAVNDLYNSVLGEEAIEMLGVSYIKEYFEMYLKMHKRYTSEIPAVSGEIIGLTYESGKFDDVERLLIGKHNSGSCIDLINYAGNETYEDCLLDNSGDVIILRHKDTGKYYARILMFRRGNVIQLAPSMGENGVKHSFDDDFYRSIAYQILNKAKENGDNIEFVFVSESAVNSESSFKTFVDERFISWFPHADYTSKVKLIQSKNPIHENQVLDNVDFEAKAKAIYYKARNINENIDEVILTRLKALRIALEEDSVIRDSLENNFEPFYKNEFSKVIYGEDWYVALKKNGEIEELILPTFDQRALIEFNKAKEIILNNSSLYNKGQNRKGV